MSKNDKTRIRPISFLVFLVALLLSGRIFFIQVVRGEEYGLLAERQYEASSATIFRRGEISFLDKNQIPVSAATLKSGYVLAVEPERIIDKEETIKKITAVFSLNEEFLRETLSKDDPYEEIAHRLTEEEKEKIEALNLPGVKIFREQWRYYPAGTLAAHTLGFVGFEGNLFSGRYGLERFYESVLLRGNYDAYQNFFAELFKEVKNTFFDRGEAREGDLLLTLEPQVQSFLEENLENLRLKYSARSGGGIIIDPTTGEIYALAVRPVFDPNNYNKEKSVAVFTNPLVESVFEMGSIFKPLTMAAGLETGVISADTYYDDYGFVRVGEEIIFNFDKKGRGRVDMQEVLNKSLNTGAVFVEQKLGKDRFRDFMYAFGFSDKTGVDLPNEVSNLVDNLESSREVEYATASFGQGIAVSPISMVRALSALANGGYLFKPHLVKKIDYILGVEEEKIPVEQGQVISPETSEEITRMLTRAFDEGLRGGLFKFSNYRVAAKTGTAQIPDNERGGYFEDRFLHSFFGYFPSYEPRFLVLLYLEDPRGAEFASDTLAEPFTNIVKFLINYYEIPPDR